MQDSLLALITPAWEPVSEWQEAYAYPPGTDEDEEKAYSLKKGNVMDLGIFSVFIVPVLFVIASVVVSAIWFDKKSKVKPSKKLLIIFISLLVLFLPFTYDIIFTNILSAYYCSQEPNPKTYIGKKVEYPISIYWEDNVYPGFSKEDRALMIINYLDGEHLKTMALNGNDGKIYVYHLDKPIWKEFKQNYKREHSGSKSFDVYRAYADKIIKTEKTYTKDTMPKLNYTVTFNEIPLSKFARKFLYSDETKVIENNTSETIAYNRRYMHFFYNIFPDFELGDRYYDQTPMCGDWRYGFERNIFQYRPNNGFKSSDLHEVDLNKYLYKKYIKGEK